jgi:uncharacterized protein YbjT (DUF2867 family)
MKAAVVGATGLVGQALLHALSNHPAYTHVVAMSRRDHHPDMAKVSWLAASFGQPGQLQALFRESDAAFCCLGTTIRKAGSREAFEQVDKHYLLAAARAARSEGCSQFHLVSAIGADAASAVFYNRVKGEVEREVRGLGFPTLAIYQPSLLLGNRQEFRAGERLAVLLAPLFSPLLRGDLEKYRPINAAQVAGAMVACSVAAHSGIQVLTRREMMALQGNG